jgi:hypothetical protein
VIPPQLIVIIPATKRIAANRKRIVSFPEDLPSILAHLAAAALALR